MLKEYTIYDKALTRLENKKMIINTINAYSYVVSKKDLLFQESLSKCEVLIPDGFSIVWAMNFLYGKKLKKIAGADLFLYEMSRMEQNKGKCFFLGSTNETLLKIKEKAQKEYPNVEIVCYSPPYKSKFSNEDNEKTLNLINDFQPDVLFIGMTAPKQEKWAFSNYPKINAGHICSIGAVFDFYAGNIKRAPVWVINLGLEWLYRFMKEPRRLWRRYLIGNSKFIYYILKEKFNR
ncbi:WecB/TagA/CpsF family glycosyltransferase [Wenyingzhuangia sp. 1_MG-2023]|nr:WecB/TagA/CpsF family glycosyltransferase [Wenyingzhuangia sp. 1_MG-2023]